MTIKQLAERAGVSPHTLRYYEREGLIPAVHRKSNGHRRYHQEHVWWIAFLRRLRASGMRIAEIRAYAELVQQGDGTLPSRRLFLERHRGRLEERIRELRDCLALVDLKIRFYRETECGSAQGDFLGFLQRNGRTVDGGLLEEGVNGRWPPSRDPENSGIGA